MHPQVNDLTQYQRLENERIDDIGTANLPSRMSRLEIGTRST